ncbi:hypothetical protein NC653_012193 [Populus alba x Populus x berolinensis]|nr:hypothetical protein NC653_012193 [Populus alba x Populus x berolinensis]
MQVSSNESVEMGFITGAINVDSIPTKREKGGKKRSGSDFAKNIDKWSCHVHESNTMPPLKQERSSKQGTKKRMQGTAVHYDL